MLKLLEKIFGAKRDKDVQALYPIVEEINEIFEELQSLSDEELRGKSDEFRALIRERIQEDEDALAEKQARLKEDITANERDRLYEEIADPQLGPNLYGKTRDHSSTIRHRICETLVLLAVHGDDLFKERLNMDISLRVDRLIERLMSNLTFEKILSLNKDLTYYAEASPKMFLKAIEQDLRTTEPVMRVLMRPTKSGILGAGIYRSDLLWALELLA